MIYYIYYTHRVSIYMFIYTLCTYILMYIEYGISMACLRAPSKLCKL